MTTVPLNPFPAATQARPESALLPLLPPLPIRPSVVSRCPLQGGEGGRRMDSQCSRIGVWRRRSEGHKPPKVDPDTPRWFLPARLWVGPVFP